MKRFFYFIIFIVVLVGGAIAALPFILSADVIREQMTEAVKSQTGRDLVIDGDATLSFFPNIALKVGKASLSNTEEMGGGVFAKMDEFRLGLELMPLLSGEMRVSGLTLAQPELSLRRTKSGAVNWEMTTGNSTTSGSSESDGSSALPLSDISLGDISITDGTVSFIDEIAGTAQKIENINVKMSLADLASILKADGSLKWNGKQVEGMLSLESPKMLLAGESSSLSLDIKSDHITSKFSGHIALLKEGVSAEGDVQLSTPSLRNLAAWTGSAMQAGPGLQGFSVTGRLQATPKRIVLNEAAINLDGMKSEGNLVVNLADKRLGLQATLAVDAINLNSYIAAGESGSGKSAPTSAGWDSTPIDFSGLGSVNADLRLSAGSITYDKVKIGKSALTVTIKDKVLTANLTELQLYEGSVKGQIVISARKKVPTISIKTTLKSIQALPLLQDVNGFDWIEGLGNINLNVTTAGSSQKQLVRSLNGKAGFSFADGAIRGINIPQMVRSVKNLKLSGWSRSAKEKTDFSKLGATFTISKGVATTKDLAMISPFIRLAGQGNVNLPAKTLDFKMSPKLVGSTKGQGGALDLGGLDIPVNIKGPWSKPSITPDLKGLLNNPENAVKAVKKIGKILKKIKPKDLLKKAKPKDILKGLLGSGGDASGNQDLNTGDLINNLLKQN